MGRFNKRWWHIPGALFVGLLLFFIATTHFNITGDFEGIYLLRCDRGLLFDIEDDIFLGEEKRVICKVEFEPVKDFLRPWKISRLYHYRSEADLHYEWSRKNGRGFVFSHFPDNKLLLMSFGRYRDNDGLVPKGLFVGGGLPFSEHGDREVTLNETGMAFFNGAEWHHLWCNVNESIAPGLSPKQMIFPSHWKFLGSRVLEESQKKLIIQSSHELSIDGVPLHIDRYVFFRAGDTYFILAMIIKNIGQVETSYYYIYGDEPWVGDYGTSIGNVGWVTDRLFPYEGEVNTRRYSFAGMFDAGNQVAAGERQLRGFTGLANFIEWLGDNRPDLVYFSNTVGRFSPESKKVPLADKSNRVFFLQWGPKFLQPGQAHTYLLAIGMAGNDPKTGFPVKPDVAFSGEDMEYLKQ